MKLFPTIEDNFRILLRAGAFEIKDEALQPMSNFKWNRLEEVATRLGVIGYIASGARCLAADPALPDWKRDEAEEVYSASRAHMFNKYKARAYEAIVDGEPHDIAPALDTLRLLRLIVAIANDIVTDSLPLVGVIALGRMLREEGDRMDYVKLEGWLKRLGVVQIASLQASLLVELFGFTPDEFPYVHRFYGSPLKHYRHLLRSALENKTQFSSVSRMNVAMSETISYHIGNFTSRIQNVEE